jgi:hypothetical protein
MKKALIASVALAISSTVFASTPEERIRNLIVSNGEVCQKVTRVFFSGEARGNKMYSVSCGGNREYFLSIGNNSGNIMTCQQLKMIARVDCFRKL